MNRVVLFLFFAFFLSIVVSSSSSSEAYPYAGIGLQQARIGFDKGYGYELIRESIPRKNLFIGYRLNDSFSIEFGFDRTFPKERISLVSHPGMAGGVPISNIISPAIFKSKFNLESYSVNFFYFYKFTKFKGFEFFSSIGPSFLKASAKRQTISIAGYDGYVTRSMKGRASGVRFSSGFQYQIKSNAIIRLSGGYSDARSLMVVENDGVMSVYVTQIGCKDIYFIGIDIIFPF